MERIQQIELEISRTQKNKATYGRRVSCGLKVSNVFRRLMMHCMVYYTRYLQVNNAQISNECKYTDSMYTLRILSVLKMLRVASSDPSCWSFCISKVGTGEYGKYRHVSDCFWTCGIKMQQVCEDWCSCLFAMVVTHHPAVRCWIWHEI